MNLNATHLRNRLRLAAHPGADARNGVNIILTVDLTTDPPTASLDPQAHQLTHTQRLAIGAALYTALFGE